MIQFKNILLLISILCFTSLSAVEYTIKTVPNPKEANNSYISNPDGILRAETVYQLNVTLDSLEAVNGSQVIAVVLESIGNEDIATFADDLFTEWGIGSKKNSNGLLILFVSDQRLVRFHTGYGLEGVLPDAITKRISTEIMIPEFKKGDYDAGFIAGVAKVKSLVQNEPFDEAVIIPWSEIIPMAGIAYIILILIAFLLIGNIIAKVKKDARYPNNIARYKAIKTEKVGILVSISLFVPIIAFVSILMFELSSYWLLLILPVPFTTIPANIYAIVAMRNIRRRPIVCGECGGKMHILSEKKEDAYLKLSQQFEEQLNAVDYDVFLCGDCKNEAIFMLDKPSAYSDCPKCGTKAFILKEKRTIVAPTYLSAGTERKTYYCKFCGYEDHHNDNIPRLQRNSTSLLGGAVAGSVFSGRGGFGGGGGGFGGGGFGGGMSGGGGSTSGW